MSPSTPAMTQVTITTDPSTKIVVNGKPATTVAVHRDERRACLSFTLPERSQPERTGREGRRSKVYEISDSLR